MTAPRTFTEQPPPDVKAVRSARGTVFRRQGIAWAADGGVPMYWSALCAGIDGPLTEHLDDERPAS